MEEHHAHDFYMRLLESKGFGKEIDYKKAIIEILRKKEVDFQLKVMDSVVSELSDIFNREAIVVDDKTLKLLVNLTIMFNYDFENRYAYSYAVQELETLHKIMYLMSAKTLTLANPQYPQTDNHTRECKAELHFEKPDYKQILKEFNELERNDNNQSKEFEKINLWVKEKEKIFLYNYDFTQNGFIEYIGQKSKCVSKYPIIDYIIDKILRLIKTVYTRSEFGMPDFLSAGEYYISVCHYCGGIFYRKRPNARFCDYYVFNANSGEEADSLRGCAKAAVDDKRSRK